MKLLYLSCIAFALTILAPAQGVTAEPAVHQRVQSLQEEWANIFYRLPENEQAQKFEILQPKVHALIERYPLEAEPLILEAIVLCSYAATEFSLGSLSKVKQAKELLLKSISLDPMAMDGSAYVVLGNLYYRLPGWPISYGDDDRARQYFETAIKLYPESIDSNYFYGDFLMDQGEFGKALYYLEKADKAPVRPQSGLSDLKLKSELKQQLKNARERNTNRNSFFSKLLPNFGTEPAK